MIKIICDECKKGKAYNPYHSLPKNWVTMVVRSGTRIKEGHFCSWECLSAYRKAKESTRIA